MRYTPQGTAVCTFSIATNRSWTDQSGQGQEDVEFTRCVAWGKLAEVCSQLLYKGRKAYVEGRLQTREWEGQDHTKRRTTEVVVDSMIALGVPPGAGESPRPVVKKPLVESSPAAPAPKNSPPVEAAAEAGMDQAIDDLVNADDIPF